MESSNIFGRRESVALNSQTFQEFANKKYKEAMTIRGAVDKIGILLVIVSVSAALGWLIATHYAEGGGFYLWLFLVALAAFVVGWFTCMDNQSARYTAPLYAFLEGSLLGGLSAITEAQYPGLAIQAVFLTFGTLFGLLVIYRVSGFRVNASFLTGVIAATLAIVLVYLANITLHLLGMGGIPFIHQSDFIGIVISLFVVCIAALNLVVDFALIENGARQGAPKFMEWYAAFGLMITLIWLYLEVLELLIRIAASSDDD